MKAGVCLQSHPPPSLAAPASQSTRSKGHLEDSPITPDLKNECKRYKKDAQQENLKLGGGGHTPQQLSQAEETILRNEAAVVGIKALREWVVGVAQRQFLFQDVGIFSCKCQNVGQGLLSSTVLMTFLLEDPPRDIFQLSGHDRRGRRLIP